MNKSKVISTSSRAVVGCYSSVMIWSVKLTSRDHCLVLIGYARRWWSLPMSGEW